ncbi:MAG: superoxide dismutase family protein [Deltaproteobacteria bacterium]|nr:superoxide dismutase family protein [Deltaproteobacteria bacterium]
MKKLLGVAALLLITVFSAHAEELVVQINLIDSTGVGRPIGTITISSSPYGTMFTPDLSGLSPGLHGFHVHENPACGPGEKQGRMIAGSAAGGHYDPARTGRHEGPYGGGHLGDLPPLYADLRGRATLPVLAPRLRISDLKGRSLVIHAGGDNYSDRPARLGGGGARVACGLVEQE